MTSINLVWRPSTKPGYHPGSLSVRLIHSRKTKTIVLAGCHLYENEWNKQNQSIIFPEDDAFREKYLQSIEEKVSYELQVIHNYLKILQTQGRYTVDDLIIMYREKKDDGKLLGYVEILTKEMERQGQERTARAYRTVAKGLVKFNKGVDISLKHINSSLIRSFESGLRQDGKAPNTISFYMRNLRAIYYKAINGKRISGIRRENPFSGVFTGVAKTMKRALSQEELKQLHDLDFCKSLKESEKAVHECKYKKNLYHTWQYFVFCFYTRGMSFVDMAYLRKENIRGGMIRYSRKKTGQLIEISITPEIRQIIDSFTDATRNSPYVFPIIKNNGISSRLQYESALRLQNYRLKKLADIAGIRKNISTHVARHTWASIGKKKNVPLRILSECLGHTSEHTTLIYLTHLDNSMLDAANEIVTSTVTQRIINPSYKSELSKGILFS